MCVHTTVDAPDRRTGQRLVVHLFNDLNTTAHHALPGDDVPLREETVPIHDIRVRFDRRLPIRRASIWSRAAQELDASTRTPQGTSVVVPRLDVHAMVVGELCTGRAVRRSADPNDARRLRMRLGCSVRFMPEMPAVDPEGSAIVG